MSVAEALASLRLSISSLGTARTVRLVCVSKTKPPSLIKEAYDEGARHFGENYVQELVDKAPQLPSDIRWHFIGHLQSNKVAALLSVPNLYMIESIDSVKIADAVNRKISASRAECLRVMVQVNTSGEPSKSGASPDLVTELCEHVLTKCPKLHLVGLMTIGKYGDSSSECFETLKNCRDRLLEAKVSGIPSIENFELSMGMSNDYKAAIESGSTSVRVGSIIFGARNYASPV